MSDDAYNELCAYTLSLGDPEFIHQHVVDAYAAQHADASTKPIGITFALAGLYLHLEKGFTGKQVQRAHMDLARRKRTWPTFALPAERGSITAADVLASDDRKKTIDEWCASVWNAYRHTRDTIAALLAVLLLVACSTTAADEHAIRTRTQEYAKAVAAMDEVRIADMFTPEGEIAGPNGLTVHGPQQIRSYLAGFRSFQVVSAVLTTDRVAVHGTTAESAGTYAQRVQLPDGEVINVRGRYTFDWLRGTDGVWRFQRVATTSDR